MSVRTSIGRSLTAGLLGATLATVAVTAVGVPAAHAAIGGTVKATTPVAIAASPAPKVGNAIVATPPVWNDGSASTAYQWMRGSTAIGGATAATYTVTIDDIGQQLTVVATGSAFLETSGTSTSAAVTGLIGDAPTPNGKITITGTPQVGSTLTVVPGKWGTDPQPSFSYQWYRSGATSATKIPGAASSTYVPSTEDLGHALAVLVTATLPGHKVGTAASNAVSLPKYASRTSFTLAKGSTPRNVPARARVVVRTPDDNPATGTVKLRDGGKKIATYTLTAGDDGVLLLTLPRFTPGKHVLKVVYSGDTTHAKSSSPTSTLTVTHPVATD